jgi:hypothetical protein
MNDLAEMSLKELCETARKEQIQIEIGIEPCEYGVTSRTVTVQPWEKYEPYFPHGIPIVYAKDKQEGR